MIQRVQSIFLFLAAVALIASLFFPFWQKADIESSEMAVLSAIKMEYLSVNTESGEKTVIMEKYLWFIGLLGVLAAATALFSIFQYNNRLKQIKLGALIAGLTAAMMLTSMYFIMYKAERLLLPEQPGTYLMGFYLPIAGMLLNFMSNRFIRKDEMLVRSADRIR